MHFIIYYNTVGDGMPTTVACRGILVPSIWTLLFIILFILIHEVKHILLVVLSVMP